MTHTQFVEFAYKTNRIYNFRVSTPSHPPPGIQFVEFVNELWNRGRMENSSIRIELNSSIRISIRLYEFRPSRNSYTNSTNFVEFVWRISLETNSVCTNFVSKPFRLYEFRLKGHELGSRQNSYTDFVYEFSTWGRISYTNFVSESNSLANFRRGGNGLSSPCP